MQPNLKWDSHIDFICSKLKKAIFALKSARPVMSRKALLLIYHSLFLRHIQYCAIIYCNTSEKNISRIEKLQKKEVKIVFNKPLDHMKIIFCYLETYFTWKKLNLLKK